jgi:hypothetical protein
MRTGWREDMRSIKMAFLEKFNKGFWMDTTEDTVTENENLRCCGNCKNSYRPRDCKWSGMVRRVCANWEWDGLTAEGRKI